MGLMRGFFLACSQSNWLRERATGYGFVRRAVSRFMPGETASDALDAAVTLGQQAIGTVFTYLGENVSDEAEAERVTVHYLEVLDRIRQLGLSTEVSVKLSQLALDLGLEVCYRNLKRIIERAGDGSAVWVDMEASNYVDSTMEIYRRARHEFPNVGICLQAYLQRTEKDLASLISMGAPIRLVKGAYQEPSSIAITRKRDVDENFFRLAKEMLGEQAQAMNIRAAFATHDRKLIRRIIDYARFRGLSRDRFEFQMLYGIQREEQLRLAREGYRSIVLVAYGSFWFPWYMRRLAERPANAWFVLRNILAA